MIRKQKRPIDTDSCLVPHDCSMNCASFMRHFKVPNATFHLCFFVFSLSYLYTVSSKSFSTSFVAQSRIMANEKHFANQRVDSDLVAMTHDDNCVKISCSIGILK